MEERGMRARTKEKMCERDRKGEDYLGVKTIYPGPLLFHPSLYFPGPLYPKYIVEECGDDSSITRKISPGTRQKFKEHGSRPYRVGSYVSTNQISRFYRQQAKALGLLSSTPRHPVKFIAGPWTLPFRVEISCTPSSPRDSIFGERYPRSTARRLLPEIHKPPRPRTLRRRAQKLPRRKLMKTDTPGIS